MPKTLATLLLASAATLSLSAAALAQTPPSAPPPGEGVKPGAVPKGQQPPVIDPAEVPPTQGDTVAPPAAAPPAPPSGVVPATPATPATPGVAPATPATPAGPATGGVTLVNGTSVKDAQGNVVGTIEKVGTGANAGEVTLAIDGKKVTVAQSVLTETNGAVVSSQTKAQILASADTKGKKDKKN